MVIIMFYLLAIISGLIIGVLDAFVVRNKKPLSAIGTIIVDLVLSNFFSLTITEFIYKITDKGSIFPISDHTMKFHIIYFVFTLICGLAFIFFTSVFGGYITFTQNKSQTKIPTVAKVSTVFVALGAAAFTGTIWGKETFGDLAADQLIINLITPKEGTSSDIMSTLFSGPVFQTLAVTLLFAVFAFSASEVFIKLREKNVKLLSLFMKKIICILLAIAVFFGGCAVGIVEFELVNIVRMYMLESKFIETNYVDPETTNLQFPEKKRNLIHIYLESMENSFTSKDMGGHMDENLIEPLTNLAKEGYSFSHLENGFGGPIATTGCVWSVASMVNMSAGIPMKAPAEPNAYGAADNFLPGAITLGDILESQGYEQSLMFGASAKFGGLNFFFESHGNFNLLDYDGVKAKGWIPEDYSVWWGYEDDKLYEFAKTELTRLYETGKPFHFVMETADTHAPDGYLSPNAPTPRASQYANVIAYSASETERFVRWIQQQPFYENTTIVIIGDHLSMDAKFFETFDPNYLRTTYNLILNPAPTVTDIPKERMQNRWWYNADMFPTILASIGVKIEGDRLALGTNLFSDTPTLFEENGGQAGWDMINKEYTYSSTFYLKNILTGKNEPFDTKNVTEYKN